MVTVVVVDIPEAALVEDDVIEVPDDPTGTEAAAAPPLAAAEVAREEGNGTDVDACGVSASEFERARS